MTNSVKEDNSSSCLFNQNSQCAIKIFNVGLSNQSLNNVILEVNQSFKTVFIEKREQ